MPQGEEIMNTYGQLSNAALLHKYGFTERNNPHEEVRVTVSITQKEGFCGNLAGHDFISANKKGLFAWMW